MKKITFIILTLFSVVLIQAQEKNEQQETVTKTTTVKGVTEQTTVTKTINRKEQVIKIDDTGVENQDEVYTDKKKVVLSKTDTETKTNPQNDAAIADIKRKQQEEIEASKKAQKEKYDAQRKELEEKRAKELKEKKKTKNGN